MDVRVRPERRLSTEEMMLLNCGAGEDLRVPWTARRSNQSIQNENNLEHSLEGLMLKLKLQHCCHVMEEPTYWKRPWCWERLKTKERWQRMKHLDSISDSMDMNLRKLQEIVKDREVWHAALHGVAKIQPQLRDWTRTSPKTIYCFILSKA